MPPEPPLPEVARPIRVLVADDAPAVRESSVAVLQLDGYDVTPCECADEALQLLERGRFDVVIVEEGMQRVDGLTVLRATRATSPNTRIIVTSGAPSVPAGEQAMRLGAWYYLPKPFTATQLHILVGLAAHPASLAVAPGPAAAARPVPPAPSAGPGVTPIGRSPAFRSMIELAKRVAGTDISVLLTGETGSGKEVLAQFIHQHSHRADRPMVSVNCSALPEALFESEVFGHRKGAFTGAVRDKPGLLEIAHNGTLFLDEVLEMPKPAQAKLLRVMQDGVVRRVGSESTDAIVNVRFIAATNGDPETAVREGRLREDLYYRLNVVRLRVPSLRERVEDIPLLANLFVTTNWRRNRPKNTPVPRLSERAIRALCEHRWRGNLRELQNVIEWATVLLAPGQEVGPEDLHLVDRGRAAFALMQSEDDLLDDPLPLARARFLAWFESRYLHWVIGRAKGNIASAARLAGMDRATLYRMMNRRGLHRPKPPAWLTTMTVGHDEDPERCQRSA